MRVLALLGLFVTLSVLSAPHKEWAPWKGLDKLTPAQLIAKLEAPDHHLYRDYHGNANFELRQLMIQRFAATKTITDSIDRLESDPGKQELVVALYHVIGIVKDAAAIEWLRTKLRGGKMDKVYESFLYDWEPRPGEMGAWRWLTDQDKWLEFWKDVFQNESSSERRVHLYVVLSQFDQPAGIEFFRARRAATSDPKEVLLVEAYLNEHDIAPDSGRIQVAIDAIEQTAEKNPDNRDFLIWAAKEMRHEAFVPYLVQYAGRKGSIDALQHITLERTIEDPQAWKAWFDEHGKEGREVWIKRAQSDFDSRLAKDRNAAAKWFGEKVYVWADIAMLPYIQEKLAPLPQFHNNLAGWINLTFQPFYRERLRPLALIVGRHPERLDPQPRAFLVVLGYIPGEPKPTWKRVVIEYNIAI